MPHLIKERLDKLQKFKMKFNDKDEDYKSCVNSSYDECGVLRKDQGCS